jgi:L-asparaginase II
LLAVRTRSGLDETFHDGVVAVAEPGGGIVAFSGDLDRPFYLRSSAKPFQAWVSQDCGADLSPLELALACASHRGHPVHIAIVGSMLEKAGLTEASLGCPPDWPIGASAYSRLRSEGHREPRRIWHNCSGKHAGFLRACVAMGWPLQGYLAPDHPLQARIISFVSALGGHRVEPVGVDGCGAPVLRTTARAMAGLFSALAADPSLRQIFQIMHRYPALVSSNGEGDAAIATTIHAAAKGGALGCIGVAVEGRLGIAVKCWDGSHDVATVAAVATLEQLGMLQPTARAALQPVAAPPSLGGGAVVGALEPRVELTHS